MIVENVSRCIIGVPEENQRRVYERITLLAIGLDGFGRQQGRSAAEAEQPVAMSFQLSGHMDDSS